MTTALLLRSPRRRADVLQAICHALDRLDQTPEQDNQIDGDYDVEQAPELGQHQGPLKVLAEWSCPALVDRWELVDQAAWVSS